jgi:hypothetical protein
MPLRLIAWLQATAEWGQVLPVAIVGAVALVEAIALPRRVWAKGVWVLAVLVSVGLATAELRVREGRQEQTRQSASGEEIAALHGLWEQWDQVSQRLPPAGGKPASSFDTLGDALASLSAQVPAIERQIAAAREQSKGRSIDDETAAKLAEYLRQYGSYPVVVSCVPNDLEAYYYANQLVNVLRVAGWDARGPEVSADRSEATAIGVTVLVRDPRSPEAAKIVLDAFTRFNIPVRSGIAGSEAIPDPATIELFVAKKS